MLRKWKQFARRVRRQSGQSLVEYALICALIAMVAVVMLRSIGTTVNTKLDSVNTNFN